MSELFTWPIRVYYEDTDASGVVYHARYLHWFERARSEWLRARGQDHQRLANEYGAAFTVAALNIRYRSPARLDDALLATVALAEQRHASSLFIQQLLGTAHPQQILASAEVKVACVDSRSFKPRAWPVDWLKS